MKLAKDKTATLFALFLMFAMTFSLVALPSANAHTPPWTIATYAFASAAPNPVGVGQTVYLNFWIDKVPPTAQGFWGCRWHDMTLTVTKPNGDTVDLGTFDSDQTGGVWVNFVPDQVGNYTFKGNFPTQVVVDENPPTLINSSQYIAGKKFVGDTFTASSASTTFTVQEQQIVTAYPGNPLPTEYWQRPMNSMNREWYSIGGNWYGLGSRQAYDSNGNFNPYTTAPDSAHVLWTKPIAFGGQIGGEFGPLDVNLYATGTPYQQKFQPVIIYGILYYTQLPATANNFGPLTAVDLRTGQTLWTVNASNTLSCGMVYNFITGDNYGGHAYLFTAPASLGSVSGSTPNVWSMYDAMTGMWILDIANPHAGTLVEGPNGELLSYRASGGQLNLWNISKCITVGSIPIWGGSSGSYTPYEVFQPPQGATLDWNDGYEWSVPIATDISGAPLSMGISRISDDVVLMTQSSEEVPGHAQSGWEVFAGYSAVDGHLLWGPINRTLTPYMAIRVSAAGEGVYVEYCSQTLTYTGYSITTGQKLWTTTPYNSSWDYFNQGAHTIIGYGNLYTWGLGGQVYAYDLQTGALNWTYFLGNAGVDTPFGVWPFQTRGPDYVLADGKLYVRTSQDYTPPVFKGAKLYCLNATTGDLIWSSLNFGIIGGQAIADGITVWHNGYDNQIYAYGKGQSATTVAASPKVSVNGDSVLVEGTVTDQSPGQTCLGVPAAGTPAISDDSMSAWMEYLYQQQPKPANATGVPVTISAIDPNGNYVTLGNTISDASGFYSFTVDTSQLGAGPGKYTIIATFAGSDSYYSSSSETAISVSAVPAATAPPTSPPASLADLYLVPGIAGIIIAIAVVGAVIVLMLRKR
jgi:outer membrane protein assembly factor BamB